MMDDGVVVTARDGTFNSPLIVLAERALRNGSCHASGAR